MRMRRVLGAVFLGTPLAVLGAAQWYRENHRPDLPPHTLRDLHDDDPVVVTGATSGIGKSAALQLARLGATLVIGTRDAARGEAVKAELLAEGARGVSIELLDCAEPASVDAFCKNVLRRNPRLAAVLGAAAEIQTTPVVTEAGFDRTFATNHLGMQALLTGLKPGLRAEGDAARPARVVIVGSKLEENGGTNFSIEALEGTRGAECAAKTPNEPALPPVQHYATTKFANMLLAQVLGEKWHEDDVHIVVVTPGMVNTGLWRHFSFPYRTLTYPVRAVGLRSPEDAALGVTFAVAATELDDIAAGQKRDGKYYTYLNDGRPIEPSALARDGELAGRLYRVCDELLRSALAAA